MIGLKDPSSNEQDIPRAERPNPLGYTGLEFARRDQQLREMERDHPKIPFKWLEWLWDTIENKPKEEVEKIIKEGLWDKQLNENRQIGGSLLGACEVLPPPPPSPRDKDELECDENGELLIKE